VALVVVAAAVGAALVTDPPADRQPLDTPAYDASSLAATPIPATGDVDAAVPPGDSGGVVVIDTTHSNRFDRADIAPLVEGLADIGYRVRFYDGDRTLFRALSGASAFVVIDPAEEFARNEFVTVRTFTRQGGHLLMVGEPNRKRVSASLFGTSVTTQESALTTLAARYDMSLGTAYLTNTGTNGGNHKHVVASPPPESGVDADRVVLFTAAAVHARGGTVLLRTAAGTHEAGLDGTDRYPVAIHKERDNVVLVGDSTLLRADRYTVADNEAFVEYLVEFLASGTPRDEGEPGANATATDGETPTTPDEPTVTDEAGTDGEADGTPTPTSTPTPTPTSAVRVGSVVDPSLPAGRPT
jgi:hypothetical protein